MFFIGLQWLLCLTDIVGPYIFNYGLNVMQIMETLDNIGGYQFAVPQLLDTR
jgi:hypothetical protein